jgi:hypothetical protein
MKKYFYKECFLSLICVLYLIGINSFVFADDENEKLVFLESKISIESKHKDLNVVDVGSNDKILNQLESQDKDEVSAKKSSDAIGSILIQAISLMGISYKWGGNTPETGMDCSGFIRYVFKKSLGINLPRTVAEMAKVGLRVKISEMEPGDLIFFNTLHGRRNSHIGMYIGNNKFIQSPRTGEKIQITEYNSYWRSHTNGVKRIVDEQTNEDGETSIADYENVKNEALPSGYIKSKHKKHKKHKKHSSLIIKKNIVKKTTQKMRKKIR